MYSGGESLSSFLGHFSVGWFQTYDTRDFYPIFFFKLGIVVGDKVNNVLASQIKFWSKKTISTIVSHHLQFPQFKMQFKVITTIVLFFVVAQTMATPTLQARDDAKTINKCTLTFMDHGFVSKA